MIDYVQEGYTALFLGLNVATSYFLGWLFLSWSGLHFFGLKNQRDGAMAIMGIVMTIEAILMHWSMPTITSVAFALFFAVHAIRYGQRST